MINSQLKKGALELCVLTLLTQKDYYGYELVKHISEEIDIAEGTIYPLLRRMKVQGYCGTYLEESTDGPSRKYYSITRIGKKFQKELLQQWIEFNQQVGALIGI